MFLFGKKRKNREWALRAILVAKAFGRLQQNFPGSAYMFARVFHNARPLLIDKSEKREKKIAIIDDELAEAEKRGAGSSISNLGVHFIRLMLESEEKIDEGSLMLSGCYANISEYGVSYREISDKDSMPTTNEKMRAVLVNSESETVSALIDKMRIESRSINRPETETQDEIWTILAMIDMQAELQSDELHAVADDLRGAILGKLSV